MRRVSQRRIQAAGPGPGPQRGADARGSRRDGRAPAKPVHERGREPRWPPDVDEWHWWRASSDQRDTNRDVWVSREEVSRAGGPTPVQTEAHRAAYARRLADGQRARRGDRTQRPGMALESQRELDNAGARCDARFNARPEYQAGYRNGFRRGYRDGYGVR